MAHAAAAPGEQAYLAVVHVHGMGVPDVRVQPAQFPHVGDRAQAEALLREARLVQRFAEMGVEPHPVAPRQRRLVAHQPLGHGEGRAGREHDAQHGAARGVVVAGDDPLAVGHDGRLVLDALVRRQAAPGLAERHGAARDHEPHADLAGRRDLVVHAAAVAENVGMVEGGGAAGQRQLRQAHQGGGARCLRRAARPDAVVRAQPVEQRGVLRGGQVARQRLVEVVVAVHQPGEQDLAGQVEHRVGGPRQALVGPDPLDEAVAREQAAAAQFAPFRVHGHHHLGAARNQRAHPAAPISAARRPRPSLSSWPGACTPSGARRRGTCRWT